MHAQRQILTAVAAIVVLLAARCARDHIEERVDSSRVQRPQVVLRSPQANVTLPPDAEIRIAADVRNIPNAIVEFGAADTPITRDDAPPYETAYRPRQFGSIVITAQVRDARGSVIAGDALTVTVLNPSSVSSTQELSSRDIAMAMGGPEPLAILREPTDQQVASAAAGVRFVVEASGLKAPLVRVEFLADGKVIRQEPMSGDTATRDVYPKPVEYLWPNPSPGKHVVMVRAIDSEGRVGTSKAATVKVEPGK